MVLHRPYFDLIISFKVTINMHIFTVHVIHEHHGENIVGLLLEGTLSGVSSAGSATARCGRCHRPRAPACTARRSHSSAQPLGQ